MNGDALNHHFREMLRAFSDAGVEFMVVGAFAVSAHGFPRATGDLDLWSRPSSENAAKVWKALLAFGAPLAKVTPADFAVEDTIYQVGIPPFRIDVITEIDGVTFDEAFPNRIFSEVDGRPIPVIGRDELIRNKRACGRPQDIGDLRRLERGHHKKKSRASKKKKSPKKKK